MFKVISTTNYHFLNALIKLTLSADKKTLYQPVTGQQSIAAAVRLNMIAIRILLTVNPEEFPFKRSGMIA
jgi:hypothetical protein